MFKEFMQELRSSVVVWLRGYDKEIEDEVLRASNQEKRLEEIKSSLLDVIERRGYRVEEKGLLSIAAALEEEGCRLPPLVNLDVAGACDTEKMVIYVSRISRISVNWVRMLAHEVMHMLLEHDEATRETAEKEAEEVTEYLLLCLDLIDEEHSRVMEIAQRGMEVK